MKVRIVYDSWIANMIVGKNITLYPFILMTRNEYFSRNSGMLAHEWIHIGQIREKGFFKFYSSYVLEFFKLLFKYRSFEEAYKNISYEKEAYGKQSSFILPEVLE